MRYPEIRKYASMNRPTLHPYKRYLPTAFDESLTLLEKMNTLIESLHEMMRVIDEHREDLSTWQDELNVSIDDELKSFKETIDESLRKYEEFRELIENDLLPESTTNKLEEWLANGTIEELINATIFEKIQTDLKNLKTHVDIIDKKFKFKNGELIENGMWSWWVHPMSINAGNRTFTSYTDNEGKCWVSMMDHSSMILTKTLITENEVDDHNAPNIIELANGKMITFYSRHNLDDVLRYRISESIRDIDFGEEMTVTLPGTVTYAQSAVDTSGRLYVFTRVGSYSWYILRSSDNGQTFPIKRELVNFGTGNQCYLRIKHRKAFNTLRIAFSGHPSIGNVHDIYYGYIRDYSGEFVVNSETVGNIEDGSGLPQTPDTLFKVYDSVATGKKARLFDIGENLEIVFAEFTGDYDGMYKYASWNGEDFDIHDVKSSGVPIGGGANRQYFGGMILPHGDEGVVYFSREQNGVWYIEKGTTLDGGKTWSFVEVSRSTSKIFRPYIPLNQSDELPLIWVKGQYSQDNYTNFDTDLVFQREIDGVKVKVTELKDSAFIQRSKGVTRINIDNNVSADKLIKFPVEFSDEPDVFVTPHALGYNLSVYGVTTTSFVARVGSNDGSIVTDEVPIRWMAIGEREGD